MVKPSVLIVGSSGTVGMELYERLSALGTVTILSWGRREIEAWERGAEHEATTLMAVDLAVLCLPGDAARRFAARAPVQLRILDASHAHRTDPQWTYGLAELAPDQDDLIHYSTRVTNPGCYATGAILLLRPLISALPDSTGLQVAITGIGGQSSGGTKMLAEAQTDPFGYRLYGLDQDHRHIREIQRYAGLAHEPIFMPAVGGYARGTTVQIPFTAAHLKLTYDQVVDLLEKAYVNSPRVAVVTRRRPARFIQGDALAGRDDVELQVLSDTAHERFVLVAQFDNLGAGSSGAAVGNIKLMLGLS